MLYHVIFQISKLLIVTYHYQVVKHKISNNTSPLNNHIGDSVSYTWNISHNKSPLNNHTNDSITDTYNISNNNSPLNNQKSSILENYKRPIKVIPDIKPLNRSFLTNQVHHMFSKG